MELQKIWCLFSVDNNYDQPPNNLVAWWSAKPSLDQFCADLKWKFPTTEDADTVAIVKIWAGEKKRLSGTDYRLAQIPEGTLLT